MKQVRFVFFTLIAAILAACSSTPTPFSSTQEIEVKSVTQTIPLPTSTEEESLIEDPSVSNTHIVAGNRHLILGDYATAQVEYQTAFDTSGDPLVRSAALWGLGRVFVVLGNPRAALSYLNQLILEYPDSAFRPNAHFLRGEILMGLNRFLEAVEAYSSYLLIRPGIIDVYVFERRGDGYSAIGNHPDAIQDYQAALSSDRIITDKSLEIKLAQAYANAGDWVTAIGSFDAIASSAEDTHTKAQMDLLSGRLLLEQGLQQEAYARFLHCVENYPLEFDSYSALVALVEAGVPVSDLDRGLIDYYHGQYGLAIDAFIRYANTFPGNDGTVYYFQSLALRESGQHQTAVDTLGFFISEFPGNFYWKSAWEEKADILWFYLDDYEAAAQTLLEFTRRTPDYNDIPPIMMDVARIYERAGLLDIAAATWESIADISTSSDLVPQALFMSGITRYRLGAYEQALLTFQRASLLSVFPSDQIKTLFWIGKTQAVLGDQSSSLASFQQAASMEPTDYYSLRAQDQIFGRTPFSLKTPYDLDIDLEAERLIADSWMRVTFNLPIDTDLSSPGALFFDGRFIRGTELWSLDLYDEAKIEFEDLYVSVSENAPDAYRLGNYLVDLGLYKTAIFSLRQVLNLAGMIEQADTLAAPRYINLIRYGLYYRELIVQYSDESNFDQLFLYSVMRQESLFDPLAGSGQGALGLMQITPPTGQYIVDRLGWPPTFTTDDLFRPMISIGLGSLHLQALQLNFSGEIYPALAAYNAGPTAASIWRDLSGPDPDLFLEVIRYPETSDYIRSIFAIFRMYNHIYSTTP